MVQIMFVMWDPIWLTKGHTIQNVYKTWFKLSEL